MKNWIRFIKKILFEFGFDYSKMVNSFRGLPSFFRDMIKYKSMMKKSQNAVPISGYYPILSDRFTQAGEASGHYFHQDLWAARKIFKENPIRHVDIGSSMIGFVSNILTFIGRLKLSTFALSKARLKVFRFCRVMLQF